MKQGYILVLFAIVLSACAERHDDALRVLDRERLVGDEAVSYENCMPLVRTGREVPDDALPAFEFIRAVSSRIFSCEYYRGQPIKVFGHAVHIKKKPVRAGYGYALADGSSVVKELLSSHNLLSYYEGEHAKIRVRVEKHHSHLSSYDKTVATYLVQGRNDILPWRTVGALSVVDFSKGGSEYTLFLWVHGARLSTKDIVERFEKILPNIIAPFNVAAKKP
ncbi:hypothetical protein HYW58_01480 [Candidatus Kaiserbacteria bacterium]|nr:hypothetical protein [Candidatus Kaiserbacteria bacterium]